MRRLIVIPAEAGIQKKICILLASAEPSAFAARHSTASARRRLAKPGHSARLGGAFGEAWAFCISGGGRHATAGFSLVEISLALLVISVGMLAILGMFPAGLDQNNRSINDTHAALFAGEVFSALRVHAETNWDGIGKADIISDIISLPSAATNGIWHADGDLRIWLDNRLETNEYRHVADFNLVDHVFRYQIALTTNGLIKAATLRFWPGKYGTTNNPVMFYSEFFKMNR